MTIVSVIIPVYNSADFIRDAINSALNQIDVNVEVVVIDDGSTDETPEILKEYGTQIKVLRQTNSGHVKARNNGAKLSSGEWLAFLDADDKWHSEKLKKQLSIATNEIGLVYTDRQNFGDITRINPIASQSGNLYEGDIFEDLLLGNFITVSSVIIRKKWFEFLKGFDTSLLVCEDWDMWLRFSGAGGITAVCREPLTLYRWSLLSMSFNHTRMLEGRLKVLQKALDSPMGKKVSETLKRKAISNVWKTSAWYAMPSKKHLSLLWYLKALYYTPKEASIYKQIVKCCLGRK
jgi:glycosyltransferase involved in cell wall biosynthesis